MVVNHILTLALVFFFCCCFAFLNILELYFFMLLQYSHTFSSPFFYILLFFSFFFRYFQSLKDITNTTRAKESSIKNLFSCVFLSVVKILFKWSIRQVYEFRSFVLMIFKVFSLTHTVSLQLALLNRFSFHVFLFPLFTH